MDSLLILVVGLLFVAYNLFALVTKRKQTKEEPDGCSKPAKATRLPPGPRGLPIVGNLFQIGPHPHRTFAELNRKYGPLVFLRLGSRPTVVTSSPHIIKEILKTQDHIFASRPATVVNQHISYNYEDVALAPTGPMWRNARRICLSELLTPKRVESFSAQRREEADNMVKSIWKDFNAGKPSDLQHTLGGFAMNVITRMLVSKSYFQGEPATGTHSEEVEMLETIQESFLLMGTLNISDYLPWLKTLDLQGYERDMIRVRRRLDRTYSKILEEHRKVREADPGGEPKDFVDLLLSSTNGEQGSAKAPLPDSTIKAFIADIVAAGTDTSAVTLEYLMAELVKNPHMLRRAQAEIDSKVGKERLVEESDVMDFHYLRCLVKETLRLHPPGPFLIPHYNTQEAELGGCHIPKGTTVIISVFGLGLNPDVWENPEQFNPDRYAHESGPDLRDPEYKFVVFGAGRRSCPGATLGGFIVLLGVARLLHCFDWACPPGRRPEDISFEEVYGMTMPLKEHLMAVGTPRLPQHLYAQLPRRA